MMEADGADGQMPAATWRLFATAEIRHRRVDAALAVRHADKVERHLDRGDRAEQHRLVQIAEMADPEDPALEPVEPAAERHVEPVERGLAHRVGVRSLRAPAPR